jgi:hypothetical protein
VIIASIGLVLVAVVLMVLGIGQGSAAPYVASIVSSALAAIALIVGVRRRAGYGDATRSRGRPSR